ncbi:MAG: hypothetical protein AAFR59_14835 [Bacteroidota bacterium]
MIEDKHECCDEHPVYPFTMKYVAFFLGTLFSFFFLSVAYAGSPLFLPAGGQVMSCQLAQEMGNATTHAPHFSTLLLDNSLVIFLLAVSVLSFGTGWLKVKMKAHQRRSIWNG